MPHTNTPGPAIYYETSGNSDDDPVVLVAGAGAQLIWWRDAFVQMLVDRGKFIIRFDNRDVGLSDKLGGPSDVAPVYTVDDMAGDICRVLDALKIASAHIVGQSLGGAIAQAMAFASPGRVRSMILFYTVPSFEAQWLTDELRQTSQSVTAPSAIPPTRAEAIAQLVEAEQVTRSRDYPFDDAWLCDYASRSYDRGYCPGGTKRHSAAARSSFGHRQDALRTLNIPSTMIHGRDDRLLKAEASFELARLIPNSELHVYPGMGHEIVPALWEEFVSIITRTTARAKGHIRHTSVQWDEA